MDIYFIIFFLNLIRRSAHVLYYLERYKGKSAGGSPTLKVNIYFIFFLIVYDRKFIDRKTILYVHDNNSYYCSSANNNTNNISTGKPTGLHYKDDL